MLRRLRITNLGPIASDEVSFERFSYFVGRNNAGKSHYLRAIELLLAQKNPDKDEICKLQKDPSQPIVIEGIFDDVSSFVDLLSKSNHRDAIRAGLQDDCLALVRKISVNPDDESTLGVRFPGEAEPRNPCGTTSTLLQVFPDVISIIATADTVDELKTKGNTAIEKLKKEVMGTFFGNLKTRTEAALAGLDEYLHSAEDGKRCDDLVDFEKDLRAELAGEFGNVVPSVKFELPSEEVIAKEMRIFLDDGHKSEVEQKGHGLQRATLLALLRLLAKRGARYQGRPAPIFLIGELETFLHPFAQKQLAESLSSLVANYQVVTTTHSPFIISPEHLDGYFRVRREAAGTRAVGANWSVLDQRVVRRHLSWRHNLEGLFADSVILVEGVSDEDFYERLRTLFDLKFPATGWTVTIQTAGKKQLASVRDFYLAMGFDDVTVIADLDYVFGRDATFMLKSLGMDPGRIAGLRGTVGWTKETDPKIQEVLQLVDLANPPVELTTLLGELAPRRVFVLAHGAPENYLRGGEVAGEGWSELQREEQLEHVEYLKALASEVVRAGLPPEAAAASDEAQPVVT